MATFPFNTNINVVTLGTLNTTSAITAFALDSAFTFGTSGDAVSYDFIAREGTTLTDLYFFVTAIAGTLGNIQCTIQLRNDNSGIAGSTVHASTTCAVNGATTWARATFGTPFTLVLGTRYHIVVYNSSGAPTTDYPTIGRINTRFAVSDSNDLTCRQSTNGGTSWTSGASKWIAVLKFGSGSVIGQPYSSASVAYANDTNERGFYIAARAVDLGIAELRPSGTTLASTSAIKLIKSTTAPGASPGSGEYSGTNSTSLGQVVFDANAIALAATAYRLVFAFSGALTEPSYTQINDYARYADVQAAAFAGGLIYGTLGNGSSWTDSPEVLPLIELRLRSVGATAGGGMSRSRSI